MSVLERGRDSYDRRDWLDASRLLSAADEGSTLEASDLELLATTAYMLGRDEEHVRILERAHHSYVAASDGARAAYCACWIGINLALRGEMAQAGGWFGRAQRLVEDESTECLERGYLMLPLMLRHEATGEFAAAYEAAAEAIEIARRFDDRDLAALSIHAQGRARVKEGKLPEGLALLDETMVSVVGGELSPIVTGIVYCSVIEACQEVYELRRAREWTSALTSWCERQPDLVSFTGKCLMHRAEVMQVQGLWDRALEEATRASERFNREANDLAAGQTLYRQGEILRCRGELKAAEGAYRNARQRGWEPQPGLALLRLAQDDAGAAVASIRRVLGESDGQSSRAALLSACVEIMLSAGLLEEARKACIELEELAGDLESGVIAAMAAQARGSIAIADGDAWAALSALRQAAHTWTLLEAPYELARVRVLTARACSAVGDNDTAALEIEAACGALAELGAAHELSRARELLTSPEHSDPHGLTPRELEVLRALAAGKTNRAIAAELVISERTVDRHVSNIFSKLGVRSRAAATAYAYEHGLVT